MSVELLFAPVDAIIRQNAGELRVSAGAIEALARRIQDHGAEFAIDAADRVTADDRKTLMAEDFGAQQIVDRDELSLPIVSIDRIARSRIDDRYRVVMDTRIALADILEDHAVNMADAAVKLAHHADRRTVQSEDIGTYFSLFE